MQQPDRERKAPAARAATAFAPFRGNAAHFSSDSPLGRMLAGAPDAEAEEEDEVDLEHQPFATPAASETFGSRAATEAPRVQAMSFGLGRARSQEGGALPIAKQRRLFAGAGEAVEPLRPGKAAPLLKKRAFLDDADDGGGVIFGEERAGGEEEEEEEEGGARPGRFSDLAWFESEQ